MEIIIIVGEGGWKPPGCRKECGARESGVGSLFGARECRSSSPQLVVRSGSVVEQFVPRKSAPKARFSLWEEKLHPDDFHWH